MNEYKKELLEYVNPGDYVKIVYGNRNDQTWVEGEIMKWDEHRLVLKKAGGRISQIYIEDIRTVDPIERNMPDVTVAINEEKAPSNEKYTISRPIRTLAPADPYHFNPKETISIIRSKLNRSENKNLINDMNGVIASLESSLNIMDSYKYHDIRAKLMRTWDICEQPVEYEVFYYLLGVLSVVAKDYDYSIEPLVRSKKFLIASYSASEGKMEETQKIFSLCSLLSGESMVIDKETAEILTDRKDAETLRKLLELYSADREQCEKIASCAYIMFTKSGGILTENITPDFTAKETAEKLLFAIPKSWKCERSAVSYWNEYNSYSYPFPSVIEETADNLVGKIYAFNGNKRWGFIEPGHYFYIRQVRNDTEEGILLRKCLHSGRWNNLEVKYNLGVSNINGLPAAYSVELTDSGYKEAKKMLDGEKRLDIHEGIVNDFHINLLTGWIESDGKTYKFDIGSVIDPFLKAYYENSFSVKKQKVSFRLKGYNVSDICWIEPDKEDFRAYSDSVKKDEIEKWEAFQKENSTLSDSDAVPDTDPYPQYEYMGLPELKNIKDPPLSWRKKGIRESQTPSGNEEEKIINELSLSVKQLAEKARREMKAGNDSKANELFEKALTKGGFNEGVVCDQVSLNMRPSGNIDKAVELIEKYEKSMSPEKIINLKIQVYDKKKDYNALCPLYEEAFRSTSSVAQKSHILYRLIDAYIKLKKYREALEKIRRWEILYANSQYSPDVEKMKKISANIDSQKAICCYYLGEREEAKRIAANLIRTNPANTAASMILEDTLKVSDADGIMYERETDAVDIDEPDENNLISSRFVNDLINKTDITDILKSKNIKDGKYTGTIKQAKDDVKSLMEKTRRTGKRRSDDLLAVCKIIIQLEQRGLNSIGHNPCIVSGRAMASWGDMMVSECNQLDTARMAYLYSLKVLVSSSEQDWSRAYNRYLRSYFMGKAELEGYIMRNSAARGEPLNNDILHDGKNPLFIEEFVVGILMLIKAIEGRDKIVNELIEDIYHNTELGKAVYEQLGFYFPVPLPSNFTVDEFKDTIRSAAEMLSKPHQELNNIMMKLIKTFLTQTSVGFSGNINIQEQNWDRFLTHTDFKRLNDIDIVVRRSQDYFSSVNFENRSDCLSNIINRTGNLLQDISKEPTDVSYDIFRPALEEIQYRIIEEQTVFYQKFMPSLTLEQKIQPFRTGEDGRVQIQLTIRNSENCQQADSICVVGVNSKDVTLNKRVPVQALRGGDDTEISLIVTPLSETATANGNFSAEIVMEYQCRDENQNLITKTIKKEFNFIIHNKDFKILNNPFKNYVKKPMLNPDLFVGRSDMINSLIKKIFLDDNRKNYGRSVALYGQTRTGKSSILYHLEQRLEGEYSNDVVIWNMGNIGINPNIETAGFLYSLLDIGNEKMLSDEKLAGLVDDELPEKILADPKNSYLYFNEYMRKIDKVLKQENKIIILMIDEFTYLHGLIKKGKLPVEFMHFWKAMLQNHCIFAVVVGQDDMIEFMEEKEYSNDFNCMETPEKLDYLDEKYAKELIRKIEEENGKIKLFGEDEAVEELYRITAGSAYLIVLLCDGLIDYLNEIGPYTLTKGIINEFLATKALGPNGFLTELNFESQIVERGHEELKDINKAVLTKVARLSQTKGYACIDEIQCDGFDSEKIKECVERLHSRKVLLKKNQNQYSIWVKLLERWLNKGG